jgi:hypothetical protein
VSDARASDLRQLALLAKAVAQLLLALEFAGRAAGMPPPAEIRSASWQLLYWALRLDARAGGP